MKRRNEKYVYFLKNLIMEKKTYIFKAFDSKRKEINLKCGTIFYAITEQEARDIRMGIEIGLHEKYKDPMVLYRCATEEELKEDKERLKKEFGLTINF